MRKVFEIIGKWIRRMIDFFYPPFSKYVSLQIFRYGVTGVANMFFDLILYFIVYHYVLEKNMLHLGFVTFSSHIASMLIVFPFTFISGFLLQKYVTFSSSKLKGRVQIIRYLSVVLANLLINYTGLKILVEFIGLFATPSKMIITVITTIFSYFSQKKYSFKLTPQPIQSKGNKSAK